MDDSCLCHQISRFGRRDEQKGWATGGVVSTMYVSSLFGFDRGFDFFEDFDLLSERKNLAGDVEAEDIIDTTISWFNKQSAEKPVFICTSMMCTMPMKHQNPMLQLLIVHLAKAI